MKHDTISGKPVVRKDWKLKLGALVVWYKTMDSPEPDNLSSVWADKKSVAYKDSQTWEMGDLLKM